MIEPTLGDWKIRFNDLDDLDEDWLDSDDEILGFSLGALQFGVKADGTTSLYTLGEAVFEDGIDSVVDQISIAAEAAKQMMLPPCEETDGPSDHIYGCCQRYKGHPGRHVEMRDGKLWAEWS